MAVSPNRYKRIEKVEIHILRYEEIVLPVPPSYPAIRFSFRWLSSAFPDCFFCFCRDRAEGVDFFNFLFILFFNDLATGSAGDACTAASANTVVPWSGSRAATIVSADGEHRTAEGRLFPLCEDQSARRSKDGSLIVIGCSPDDTNVRGEG